jgi:hypothetical protein
MLLQSRNRSQLEWEHAFSKQDCFFFNKSKQDSQCTCWGNSPVSSCMLISSFAARSSGTGSISNWRACPFKWTPQSDSVIGKKIITCCMEVFRKSSTLIMHFKGKINKPVQHALKLTSPKKCWLHEQCRCQYNPVKVLSTKYNKFRFPYKPKVST